MITYFHHPEKELSGVKINDKFVYFGGEAAQSLETIAQVLMPQDRISHDVPPEYYYDHLGPEEAKDLFPDYDFSHMEEQKGE